MATTNQTKSIVISEEDVSVLECPICFYIPAANDQIYLCKNGHHICKNCYSKLSSKKCPLCRLELFQTFSEKNQRKSSFCNILILQKSSVFIAFFYFF